MGKIDNSVVINAPLDRVFAMTNDIANWRSLFDEYEESTVLETEGNVVTFRLTKKPDPSDGRRRSWVSRRTIDRERLRCVAERLEPKYPFTRMNIEWLYEPVPEGVRMTWMQDFEVDPKCPFTETEMERYLNDNTRVEMTVIKGKIERAAADASADPRTR